MRKRPLSVIPYVKREGGGVRVQPLSNPIANIPDFYHAS